MSITRQLLNEFRPLFRVLDEPFGRAPSVFSTRSSPFDDFWRSGPSRPHLAMDVTDKGDKYLVEADLPGVPKENIEVKVGDGGRSITIEGQSRYVSPSNAQGTANQSSQSEAVTKASETTNDQAPSERQFVGNSSFSRTVWLPQPVDSVNVSAQLKDGVLTVSIPKREDEGSVKIPIL